MSVHLLGFSGKKFFMNKKDQICPFSCALVPFTVKAIMRFNLIPVHPQHRGLGMRPFRAGQRVDWDQLHCFNFQKLTTIQLHNLIMGYNFC